MKPLILGAHYSVAGGYYKAVDQAEKNRVAAELPLSCCQIFSKNNNQWKAKTIVDDDVRKFRESLDAAKVTHTLSHASYLINLASPKKDLWQKSVDAFAIELQRAELLGVPYVVLHPGSYTTSSESLGLQAIARGLNEVHQQVGDIKAQCLLENTAGQGTNLGCEFEHLASIIDNVKQPERVGVCIDTCHTFAAGHPLTTPKEFEQTIGKIDSLVGTDKIRAFHLNDSKKEFGSKKDRHENIGEGCMGLEPFRNLLNDERFREIPMYLETPKGTHEVTDEDWDVINLRTLRRLVTS